MMFQCRVSFAADAHYWTNPACWQWSVVIFYVLDFIIKKIFVIPANAKRRSNVVLILGQCL